MTDLRELERNRLKMYGELLKRDWADKQEQERLERQRRAIEQSQELERHLEFTRQFDKAKKMQIKEQNQILQQDNLTLSTFKAQGYPKDQYFAHANSPAHKSILDQIQESDVARMSLNRQKNNWRVQQNLSKLQAERNDREEERSVEREEELKHVRRVGEMQQNSRRNYEEIKRKHQQDMSLFEQHRRLVGQNEHYQQKLQEFTHCQKDILDHIRRNEHEERRLMHHQLQDTLKHQIQQQEIRKNSELAQQKAAPDDLQNSMLSSVLFKSPRYQKKAYIGQLQGQISEVEQRRAKEQKERKQRTYVQGIYGGVPTREREHMLHIIDRTLGIEQARTPSLSRSFEYKESSQANQSVVANPQQRVSTPKLSTKAPTIADDYSRPEKVRKDYRVLDPVTGRNKVYQQF